MFAHISVLCAPRDVCLSLHPSVPHRDTAESQPLSPSMLCYRQAAIYNNQLISQRVVPDSQQLLNWQTQILPPHSHTQTRTHTDTSEQMEARWRRRGGERIYSSLFPSSTCVAVAVDHPVWWVDGWGADKTLSDRRSPQCTPRPGEKTRLLLVLLYLLCLLQVSR